MDKHQNVYIKRRVVKYLLKNVNFTILKFK